jgi:hypothetical protein
MKIILIIVTFISGGFFAYGIGKLIYWLHKGPSLFVGCLPIIIAVAIAVLSQSGGSIKDMTILQSSLAGFTLGMVSCGVYLFWSQESWGP